MDDLNKSNISGTTLSGWQISKAAIASTFGWFLIYNMSRLTFPDKRPVWHSRLVVLIYGVVICSMIAFMTRTLHNPWPLESAAFRLALIQMAVGANKSANLQKAAQLIKTATKEGANIVALPECFNSPYGTSYFAEYAEKIPGESTEVLAKAAKENSVYLVGGSLPEVDGEKYYNTCTVFDPQGNMIAKHRKIHLFDIDVPGKIRFQESEVLTPGNTFTSFTTSFCKVGVGICYDIRFQEMAQVYNKNGCSLILYPGAFNMTTGPAHWELLARARALDNQLYVASISPARDEKGSYIAWGHSTAVNPWGEIIAKADTTETIVYADIDLEKMEEIRQNIPLRNQRRNDLYEVKDLNSKTD